MMLYLMFVPVIIGEIFFIAYLVRVRREDRVIVNFCRVREHIMAFLASKEGQQLVAEDYSYVRWLLEMNTATVSQFKKIKHKLNITSALSGLRHIDSDLVMPARAYHHSGNELLEELYQQSVGAMIKAFIAYTPFFGSKIIFNITLAVARLLAKIGFRFVKLRAKEFTERWDNIHQSNLGYC